MTSEVSQLCPANYQLQFRAAYGQSQAERAKQEYAYRLEQHMELDAAEKLATKNLGNAIFEGDFVRFEALVQGFAGNPRLLERLTQVLAQELNCPGVTVLRTMVSGWRTKTALKPHDIYVVSLQLDDIRRILNVATDRLFGVQVLGPSKQGTILPLNEDPRLLFRQIGGVATQGPPPMSLSA